MIRVLAVAFAPEPGRRASAAQQAMAVLRVEHWAPRGCDLRFLTAPWGWWGTTELIAGAARGVDAVVLFGPTDHLDARVARYPVNEADPELIDAMGLRWPGRVLAPGAPPLLPTAVRADALAAALEMAGLAAVADASSRCVANRVCFDLLIERPDRPTAPVLLPLSLEAARGDRASGPNRLDLICGMQAALTFAAAAAETARAA
jgi:hypothetical protein